MVQRHSKSGFMPSAWVFPGGRVDEQDALPVSEQVAGGQQAARWMERPLEQARAFLVAGVRETLEESGVWLGQGQVTDEARLKLAAGDDTFVELMQRVGLSVDLDVLHPWAWWLTPEIEPKRYDTRFFVAAVSSDAQGRHDEHETVDSGWFELADLLAKVEARELPMAPPTWWTLTELNGFEDVQSVLEASRSRSRRGIMPVIEQEDGDWVLRLPGHQRHPEPPIAGLPTLIRFCQGRWWAES